MIADSLVSEFDQEMKSTRRLFERIPEGDASWKPHEKSMSLGQLSMHLANLPTWASMALSHTEFDMHPPGGERVTTPPFKSREDVLAFFGQNVAKARETMVSTSDEEMMNSWTLKNRGEAVFSLPKIAVLRSFVLNHMIHHRGQLTVYLRLRDVPLPGIYGPSADERM